MQGYSQNARSASSLFLAMTNHRYLLWRTRKRATSANQSGIN